MSVSDFAPHGNERARWTSMIETYSMMMLADERMLERHSTWHTGKQRALAGSCCPVDGWHTKDDRTLDEKTERTMHECSDGSSDVAHMIIMHGCVSGEPCPTVMSTFVENPSMSTHYLSTELFRLSQFEGCSLEMSPREFSFSRRMSLTHTLPPFRLREDALVSAQCDHSSFIPCS